jgi:hypothetical protein
MTRHEAEILWKVLLAMRREHHETAYALANGLLRSALREFTQEDADNSRLHRELHDDQSDE